MTGEKQKLEDTTDGLQRIFEELDETGGEMTPELEAELDKLKTTQKETAQRIVWFTRQMRAMAKGLKDLAKDYSDKAAKRIRAADYMERLLLAEMQLLGDDGKQIFTDLFTIKRSRIGRPQIELRPGVEISEIDETLIRVVPEKREVDKNQVYEMLKLTDGIPKEVGQFDVGQWVVKVRERLSIS
jgi:hypothetical protein